MRQIVVGASDSLSTRVYFDIRLLDGKSPALDRAGQQPLVSINGGSFSNIGIGALQSSGYGKYYAQLDSGILTTSGDIIQTVYVSGITEQSNGDTFQVVDSITGQPPGDATFVDFYGTVQEADVFFSQRLNTLPWDNADPETKQKSIIHATQIIDKLNYGGEQANDGQVLQFPRKNIFVDTSLIFSSNSTPPAPPGFEVVGTNDEGTIFESKDVNVPVEIKQATYLTGLALIDGWDPDTEAANLHVIVDKYGAASTSYNYAGIAPYILAGLPSITVWNLLQPFLRDPHAMSLTRSS